MIVDTSGIDRLMARLRKIAEPNAAPLLDHWSKIIQEDNRKGILAGTDKNGVPMRPVTYRPKPAAKPVTKAQRSGERANVRYGKYLAGQGGNLTSAEYRVLGGPPLAPRGQFSRVIANLKTDFTPANGILKQGMQGQAFGYWDEVVSRKGFHFLPIHFDGLPLGKRGPAKQRDLRGVRPEGVEKAKVALRNWAIGLVRERG